MRVGILPRLGSFWVGAHWSPYYKRLCINFVPCVTVWFTFKGGKTPAEAKAETKLLREDQRKLRLVYQRIRDLTWL